MHLYVNIPFFFMAVFFDTVILSDRLNPTQLGLGVETKSINPFIQDSRSFGPGTSALAEEPDEHVQPQ